jgi:hypothetical protein
MTTSSSLPSPTPLRPAAWKSAAASIFTGLGLLLRRSRSLSSILPSFLASGVLTLIATAVIHWSSAPVEGLVGTWLESWLIAWSIVFPVAYVSSLTTQNIAAALAEPAEQSEQQTRAALNEVAAAFNARTNKSRTMLDGLKLKKDARA